MRFFVAGESRSAAATRALVFLLFCSLLLVNGHFRWACVVCATLFVSWVYPKARWPVMIFASVVSAGQATIYAQTRRQLITDGSLPPFENSFVLRTFLFLVAVSIAIAYREAIHRLPPSHLLRKHAFAFYFSAVFLGAAAFSLISGPAFVTGPSWWLMFYSAGMSPFVFYEIESIGATEGFSLWQRILFLRPFWQIFFIAPFPRGATDLVQTRVTGEEGRYAFHAFRLLVWATILRGVRLLFVAVMFRGSLPSALAFLAPYRVNLPHLARVINVPAVLEQLSLPQLWMVITSDFANHFLQYATRGHIVVSVIRMFGYGIPRNTYRPLESTSLAQFFGRYNFYFKELLWRSFFFPTFRRAFRGHLRTRIVFAVFMSVGLGNFLFHLSRDIVVISDVGVGGVLRTHAAYAVYCLALSAAVSVSMVLSFGRSRRRPWWLHVTAIAGYLLFFSVLRIFDDDFIGDIHSNFAVFCRLFGA